MRSLPKGSTEVRRLLWTSVTIEASDHLPIFAMFTLPGDFNDNNVLNADGIDLLRIAINTNSTGPIYDVNGGGLDDGAC